MPHRNHLDSCYNWFKTMTFSEPQLHDVTHGFSIMSVWFSFCQTSSSFLVILTFLPKPKVYLRVYFSAYVISAVALHLQSYETLNVFLLPCSLSLFCSLYYILKTCVEEAVKQSWCMGYTTMVDEVFLKVHQTYFSFCRQVHDPPLHTLLLLIAPGVIITLFLPFLCIHLTIDKTEAL